MEIGMPLEQFLIVMAGIIGAVIATLPGSGAKPATSRRLLFTIVVTRKWKGTVGDTVDVITEAELRVLRRGS